MINSFLRHLSSRARGEQIETFSATQIGPMLNARLKRNSSNHSIKMMSSRRPISRGDNLAPQTRTQTSPLCSDNNCNPVPESTWLRVLDLDRNRNRIISNARPLAGARNNKSVDTADVNLVRYASDRERNGPPQSPLQTYNKFAVTTRSSSKMIDRIRALARLRC